MKKEIIQILRKKPLPRGLRRFVRQQKNLIRRNFYLPSEQEARIQELYRKIFRL